VGTVVAGFALLPAWGLSRTALFAGATSLGLGLVMTWTGRPEADGARPAAVSAAATPAGATLPAPDFRPRLMAVLFAVSGFVSLTAQIAWSRVAGVLLGSSGSLFSLAWLRPRGRPAPRLSCRGDAARRLVELFAAAD
jgi:hypothetical protein